MYSQTQYLTAATGYLQIPWNDPQALTTENAAWVAESVWRLNRKEASLTLAAN
jgi:hypothetical protein